MKLLASSSPARWMVVPVALLAMLARPDLAATAGMVLVGLCSIAFVEQSVRLGVLPPWVKWLGRVAGLVAIGAVYLFRLDWAEGSLPYGDLFVILLAGSAGLLIGLFLASLGHAARRPEHQADTATPRRKVLEIFSDANRLAVIEERPSPELPLAQQNVDPTEYEVYVDGKWTPAVLDCWTTRDLGLFGRVTLIMGGETRTDWVPAAQLRKVDRG